MIGPNNATMPLKPGQTPTALDSGEKLAEELLAEHTTSEEPELLLEQSGSQPVEVAPDHSSVTDDEAAASDRLAETLNSLQNLVERRAVELERISGELGAKREQLKDVFANDTSLAEVQEQLTTISEQVKAKRSQMQTDPTIVRLKVQIGELNDQKKELEETLSNHLVSYHQMTNSTSFDTSDGDQWEFNIKAKIKPRKK